MSGSRRGGYVLGLLPAFSGCGRHTLELGAAPTVCLCRRSRLLFAQASIRRGSRLLFAQASNPRPLLLGGHSRRRRRAVGPAASLGVLALSGRVSCLLLRCTGSRSLGICGPLPAA